MNLSDDGQPPPWKEISLFHFARRSDVKKHKNRPLGGLPACHEAISARTTDDLHAGASDLPRKIRRHWPKERPQQLPLAVPVLMAVFETVAARHIRERRKAERDQHAAEQHLDGTM